MEKKNNQMVDKEKELKSVAPDTDVAPDVTDASSFSGRTFPYLVQPSTDAVD